MRRVFISEDLLKAWREGLGEASCSPKLMRQIERYEGNLLPRFVEQYKRLRALPRRVRRAVQRKWRHSLAGVALLMALGGGTAAATTFNVPCGNNTALIRAINDSNDEVANPGADTINLVSNCTHRLTSVNNTTYGATGLPVINSAITIDGNGSTIMRRGGPFFRIFTVGNRGNLTLQETTVMGGTQSRGPGGAGVSNRGTLTLTNSTVSGNSIHGGTYASGGGVHNSGTLTITNSTISGNFISRYNGYAVGGGGVSNFGTLTITNSTISGNSTSGGQYIDGGDGGGVFNGGTLTITNSTISGNSASDDGGGVANGGTLFNFNGSITLTRTLVSGNQATQQGPEIRNNSGTVTANNFNLFGYSGGSGVSGFTPGATDIVPGVGLSAILNTTLANNGGKTQTHALVPGSPAVDAVTTGCPPPPTDQRGFTRPVDGNNSSTAECDIGSFEYGSTPLCNGFTVTIFGTVGNDVINGTAGPDVIAGLGGNDTINGREGNDIICGGPGRDIINGGAGNDLLLGQGGRDTLNGDSGDDELRGGSGNDTMDGGTETDTCNGGANTASGADTAVNCETVTNVP